jgi:CO/xanthine dehydrogenase FAD-binding subunit
VKRLPAFELVRATSLAEAAELLVAGRGGARPLAGGTDLLVDMKQERARPSLLVDLKSIPGLGGIEGGKGGVHIGATVTAAALAETAALGGEFLALQEAAGCLGPPPVRRLATVGGNLGRASPASDLTLALLALDARVRITGQGKELRECSVSHLLAGPGQTSLGRGEVISGVFLPRGPAGRASAHLKLGRRGAGWDLALVGVAVAMVLAEGGEVADVRIALASVGPTVFQATEAEACLRGRDLTEGVLTEAAQAAAAQSRPIDDLRASADYRRRLTGVLTRRALTLVRDRAVGGERGR